MGPLFVFLIMAMLAGALFVCGFVILLFKCSIRLAFALAAAFAGGAVLSFYLAIFAATLVVGARSTLQSSFAIYVYLAWLASASVAGGILTAFCARRLIRHRWSKPLPVPLR